MNIILTLIVVLFVGGCATPLTLEEQKALRDSVVGEYEHKDENEYTWKMVLLENGLLETYLDGINPIKSKWSIVNGLIHVDYSPIIYVFRINRDTSITRIVGIDNGKRFDLLKPDIDTFKKIK